MAADRVAPAPAPAPASFQRIVEAAPVAILILRADAAFTIADASDEFLRFTLTRRERIVGRPLFDVFPDNPAATEADASASLLRSLRRVVASRAPDAIAVQRHDVPAPDGGGSQLRYWRLLNAPVFGGGGELEYIVHRVEDVTADSAPTTPGDDVLATLAHELRNPLAAITSALQLLETHGPDADRQAQCRAACRRQVGNMARLVEDIYDLARMDRGALTLERTHLDLREAVDAALQGTQAAALRQRVTVAVRIAAGDYRMEGDALRLEQVLANLLNNAIKFSPRDGLVELTLAPFERAGLPWARIAVADQGRGIPPDRLDAIFGKFVQVDAAGDRARGGLGIGLAVVRMLVGLQGGQAWAHSAGLGRGSTFTVELPLA